MSAITPKELRGYMAQRRETLPAGMGITFNDAYNVATWGITRARCAEIDRAMSAAYGVCAPRSPKLSDLNRHMEVNK